MLGKRSFGSKAILLLTAGAVFSCAMLTSCTDILSDLSDNGSRHQGRSRDDETDETSAFTAPYVPTRLVEGTLGSAAELSGNIVIVSIFSNDDDGSWNLMNPHDLTAREATLTDLEIATEWIEENAAAYDRDVEFIWDFEENEDLLYEAKFDFPAFTTIYEADYQPFFDALDETVPTDELIDRYDADGIMYLFFFDDTYDPDRRTCARPYYGDLVHDYEMCFINMNDIYGADEIMGPASLAHEMLHLFGAQDLYWINPDGVGITQEYIDYVNEVGLNDIMLTVYDPDTGEEHPDRIVNEITEITAYYIGFTDHSDTVEEWGFEPSEHLS